METVGRFAPSPSGRLHLGNLLCALLVWLSARQKDGRVLLRVEDLDTARCPRRYSEQMERDLQWLGLDWDIGPGRDNGTGPYYQSQRTEIYQAALETLREKGLVYPCFCTRAEIHAASAPHREDGQVVYAGTCRRLTAAEIAEKSRNRAPALRLITPEERWGFTDGHMGRYEENLAADCGDFLLRRSDGMFAYQLAVVVDDAAMGVTEVVRGADLLDSTPRQLYLYHLLGLTPPVFHAGRRRGTGQLAVQAAPGGNFGTVGVPSKVQSLCRAENGGGAAGGLRVGEGTASGYPDPGRTFLLRFFQMACFGGAAAIGSYTEP